MSQVNRLQSLVLGLALMLVLLLSAVTLTAKPTAVGNRLTVISTTDVINELSPCG